MLVQIVSVRFHPSLLTILLQQLSMRSKMIDTDSSQGRIDPNFQDDNHELISTLLSRHDKCSSLEVCPSSLCHLHLN